MNWPLLAWAVATVVAVVAFALPWGVAGAGWGAWLVSAPWLVGCFLWRWGGESYADTLRAEGRRAELAHQRSLKAREAMPTLVEEAGDIAEHDVWEAEAARGPEAHNWRGE